MLCWNIFKKLCIILKNKRKEIKEIEGGKIKSLGGFPLVFFFLDSGPLPSFFASMDELEMGNLLMIANNLQIADCIGPKYSQAMAILLSSVTVDFCGEKQTWN